jgi:hypothetical protein
MECANYLCNGKVSTGPVFHDNCKDRIDKAVEIL